MVNNRVKLNEALKFHGHLGPYLVLGILAGELALKRLRCKKYFGLEVKVWGANQKPKSCLIDGLQLSTGATYGKGNIEKLDGKAIRVDFVNKEDNRRISIRLRKQIIKSLQKTKTHTASEVLAKKLYKNKFSKIFTLIP